MKMFWSGLFLVILALILIAMPAMAAGPVDNTGKGPVDKITFVHFPKHEAKKSPPGTSSGGTLCPDFKYSGVHWGTGTVNFYINDNSGVVGAADAIRASFNTWTNASNNKINFNYIDSTSSDAGYVDGLNVISWADISSQYPNAIALTSIWYYRQSREIVEVDTQMNAGFVWSCTVSDVTNDLSQPAIKDTSRYDDPTNEGILGTYDVQNIMTHEAGHWIMLNDLYNNKDGDLTMYGYGSPGELKKVTLGYGDELGIESAYP
jgi:hypothetical protein